MKTGTFPEAFCSLKERFQKNIFENRVMMIFLWCQSALILGMVCLYLVIGASTAYEIRQIEAHAHQPASIDWLLSVGWTGFWLFTIGLPILTLILGIAGFLPGTHRKIK
jgi:hypothetical protein